jgi:hypothetical protein
LRPDFTNLLGKDLFTDSNLDASIESGRTAFSLIIRTPGDGLALFALQAVYFDLETPESADERWSGVDGAVGLYLDGDTFFDNIHMHAQNLSFWLVDFDGQVGEAVPIYAYKTENAAGGLGLLLQPFESAIQFEVSGRSFWISASTQPTLHDL